MRKSLFSLALVGALASGIGVTSAQTTSTTTTTTWTPDQRAAITEYSTTKHYESFNDPAMAPTVGMVLPGSVTLYPLPRTVTVPAPEQYSYSIINNQPVVVNRTTRTVVHTW
jgi:hypothetical protein